LTEIKEKGMDALQTALITLATLIAGTAAYTIWPEHLALFAVLVGAQLLNTLVVKQVPGADRAMHRPIVILPRWLKCPFNLNCKGRGCQPTGTGEYENQGSADLDGFAVGHFVMWALVGALDRELPLYFVVLWSVVFEAIEAAAGCIGWRMHARVTDVIVNTAGFLVGRLVVS